MLIRILRTHLRPHRRLLIAVVVLQALQTTAALTLPALNARIIDEGVLRGNVGVIWRFGGLMVGFSFAQVIFNVGAVYFAARVAMAFGRDIRNNVFHQVTGFSAREVGTFGAPSLITRITNDVQQVQMLVVMGTTMLIAAPITMVVGIVMAMREDVGLSVVLAVCVPATILLLGPVIAQMMPTYERMQERIDEVNRVLREQITGLRVVRAFVREPQERARFKRANDDLTAVSLRAGRLMSVMFPTVMLIINVSSVGVLWVGADRVGARDLPIGSLVAYLSYLVQILMAVIMATFMVSMIPRAAVSAARLQEVLDTDSTVVPPVRPIREVSSTADLELRSVGFHYPGAEHPVLSDISFDIKAGQTVAVVGSTGAGKTTLVNLIPRLFDATAGAVFVDGVDVRMLDPNVLTDKIGLVPQKPYLFSGTVASNLRYGRPDADEIEMWAALEVAQAADFVRALPAGLDARVEQGGNNLSGGQRQRLSIARALVRRPEIYVFDDCFSALDLATDARLRAALGPYTANSAVLTVAQRISTIIAADQILVIEDGQIIGRGTHDELLTGCSTYTEIVESQLGEGAVA